MRRVAWSGAVGLVVLGLVGMTLPVGRGAAPALAEQQGTAMGQPGAGAASRITRIVVERVEAPAFEGRSFGEVGQYEKLVGRAYGEVDPADPRHAGIVNLARAPRNARGLVEYDTDVYILKPVDGARGNATIFYEVPNRGNKTLRFNADAGRSNDYTRAAEAGDGFVMRQGYTLVWSAWQGDVLPGNDRLTARFPVATNPDGNPIREWIRT